MPKVVSSPPPAAAQAKGPSLEQVAANTAVFRSGGSGGPEP